MPVIIGKVLAFVIYSFFPILHVESFCAGGIALRSRVNARLFLLCPGDFGRPAPFQVAVASVKSGAFYEKIPSLPRLKTHKRGVEGIRI
ncbi:hypothetical protein BC343_13630 [Mucilaginibacter pedocola]|uniref:Uncharacterized protein n=1 Tax=Mucilaginibacter pedocola TaxID=1792845 RepID=A0A1S9PAG0_9SPHI|nr:hypothetical protein BC343_13630 [Mucilaginibacter pedocola]